MRTGTRILFSLLLLFAFQSSYSQLDGGAFNSTGSGFSVVSLNDYQSLGVNPANLGWQKSSHKMHVGFFEFGLSIYSEPLTKSMVYNDLLGNSTDFTDQSQRNDAIKRFTDTELLIDISNTLFGFSYQDEKLGGFAFAVRQRISWRSTLNEQASEFLFEGYNSPYFDSIVIQPNGDTIGYSTNPDEASKLYNPTDISHLFYNEFVLGYGRKLVDKENFKFYAGIDLKILQGYGMLNYNSISATQVEGYQALSPSYGVKYDEPTPSELTGSGWQTAGMGFGIDIGVSFEIYQKTRIAIALNDVGAIKWDGNVYQGENVPIWKIETPGIDNYNIFSESGGIIADNSNLGEWKGLKNKTVSTPMHLRAGANHQAMDELAFGLEILIPLGSDDLPGAYVNPYYAAGAQYSPAKWFQLSAGVSYGGGYGLNIPLGLTFRPINNESIIWEAGFASRDILTWFKTNDPVVSMVFGFLRFGFGGN
ncbi:MAG: hypothetical protein KAJ50_09645 [Bacteroidales bacterium]|nr:hypothetical protein [Bacteroidales bacterium]